MECKYCKSTLRTARSLAVHQKTAKFCIKIQREMLIHIEVSYYTCGGCTKKFTVKRDYDYHCERCTGSMRQEIESLKSTIALLREENAALLVYKELANNNQKCITELAKQPKTHNNTLNTLNTLNMMTPLDMKSSEFAQIIKDNFTKDHLLEGQRGVAKFAVDKLLKDENGKLKYVCTDPSRHIYKFKTIEGGIERDVRARKLTDAILPDLMKHSHTIAVEQLIQADSDLFVIINNNYQEIREMAEDNGDFYSTLTSLVT